MAVSSHHNRRKVNNNIVNHVISETLGSLVSHFHPTALKGCVGIVFIHGTQMGCWVGDSRICPGCISETVRRRRLICGRDIGWRCRWATS